MKKLQKSYFKFFIFLKRKKDELFLPLLKILDKTGISPSMITIFGFLLGVFSVFFLFFNKTIFIVLILLHVFFDGLDGSLARHQKRVSEFWGKVDYYFDHIVLVLIIIASIFLSQDKLIAILLLILVIINNFVFVFFNSKYEIIAIRMIYILIAIFSLFFANFVVLCLSSFNFVIILYNLLKVKD